MDLPPIARENIDQKISRIKAETPDNCFKHAGVNCAAGADSDGSVVCNDGYRDAILPFNFSCLEASLQVLGLEIPTARTIRITVQNKSDAEARQVEIFSTLSWQGEKIRAMGPEKIAPNALEEYEFRGEHWTEAEVGNIRKYLKLLCENCR